MFEVRRDEARRNLLLFGARIDTKNSRGKTARDIIEQRTRKWEDEGIDMNSVNSEGLSESTKAPYGPEYKAYRISKRCKSTDTLRILANSLLFASGLL